jgi:hypothetical protein
VLPALVVLVLVLALVLAPVPVFAELVPRAPCTPCSGKRAQIQEILRHSARET